MNDANMGPPAGGDLLGTLVVIIGSIATLYTFVLAVFTSVRPGETDAAHPKQLIFKDDR